MGDVLRFLKAPEPDWLDLFMASELLESAAGSPGGRRRVRENFTANSQEGRHARGPYENLPLSRRMDLRQARRFVAELARQWLDWWIVDEVGARTASCENERRKRKERPGKSGR